jgi:hypothetical protein
MLSRNNFAVHIVHRVCIPVISPSNYPGRDAKSHGEFKSPFLLI